jgi:hypothetical protein
MENFSKSIACVFFFLLSITFIQAQDTIQPIKFRRNAIKIGTSLTLAKLFVGYEHAVTKHVGIGILGSVNVGLFSGYTGNLAVRYYFGKYKGLFIESRYGCSYFNPVAYSDLKIGNNRDRIYGGEHRATITYWSLGVSAGYRVLCSKRLFFDFLIGLHEGDVTFGKDDIYIERSNIIGFTPGSDKIQDVFSSSGPAMPLHLMINLGFAF